MKDGAYMAIGAVFAFTCSALVLSTLAWLALNALCKALGLTMAVVSVIVHRPLLRWLHGESPSTGCFVCGRNCDHGRAGDPVGLSAVDGGTP